MATRTRRRLPARLESTRQRFERWRRTRKQGARIPEPLWNAAVNLVRSHGIYQTASALGVDYAYLKRRVEQKEASAPRTVAPAPVAKAPNNQSGPTFLELTPAPTGAGECVLELESAAGAKMRVHLKGVAAPDLAALTRSFWGQQS
jgi:hypothetical protein